MRRPFLDGSRIGRRSARGAYVEKIMFQPWRLRLREAEEALKSGRLDEASRLLCDEELRKYFPAKKLLANAAQQMVARGQLHAQKAETAAGWRDLQAAAELGAEAQALSPLREKLMQLAVAEAERFLAAGNIDACLATLDRLGHRGGEAHALRQLKHVVRKVELARRQWRQGKMAEAEETLAAAIALRPETSMLHEMRSECQQKHDESRRLAEQLHQALATGDWASAASVSDQLLAISPELPLALDARRRAWNAVGMQVDAAARTRGIAAAAQGLSEPMPVANGHPQGAPAAAVASSLPPGRRFLLWIDGVGGYLVCEGEEIVLGQPAPNGRVDVPILGDVSRHHAKIHRNGEGYLITPLRRTRVNGREVESVTSLANGSLLELGEGVQMRFRRPHALSGTARLEFASRHRTQPTSDAVLLLADSCVLGPAGNSHVVCRNWTRQVVIFRQDGELWLRTTGTFQIDGCLCEGEGALKRNSQIAGEDFSLSLEEL
jgi:hypothetical protein